MTMALLARVIVAMILLQLGMSQLIMPMRRYDHHPSYQPEPRFAFFEHPTAAQKPLLAIKDDSDKYYHDKSPYRAGQFTLRSQDETICDAGGSAQWSGTVDVSDSHRLFFWAFESRGDPSRDPIIVWLNGGPGSSSLMGGFGEMGGCMLRDDSNGTEYNPFGWNRHATVVILDQPAGVGFSTIAEGGTVPTRDEDGAEDFQTFLNILLSDVFPEKKHLPLVIAAESYGGHFAPTYVKHILDSRSYASPSAFRGNLSGVVLIDAVIDFGYTIIGGYDLLCESENGRGILNETGCTYMKENVPRCEELLDVCTVTQNLDVCYEMVQECSAMNYPFDELASKNKQNPYNIHKGCPHFPNCIVFGGLTDIYFNKPDVKAALGYSPEFTFQQRNMDLNMGYWDTRSATRPTLREVAAMLDAHRTPPVIAVKSASSSSSPQDNPGGLADIRILVLNGNDDFLVNTAGIKRAYDNVRWSGQAEFRAAPYKPIQGVPGAEGDWKATRDGRLTFVSLDGAGHVLPHDVREGSLEVLERWLAGQSQF